MANKVLHNEVDGREKEMLRVMAFEYKTSERAVLCGLLSLSPAWTKRVREYWSRQGNSAPSAE